MFTLVCPRWIIPVDPPGQVLENHVLVLSGPRIAAILPWAEAITLYAGAERISLPDHALLPGFVNLHTHAAMTLLRGFADDLPLMEWLTRHIWPAEQRHVSDEFVYDGSLLAFAEMIRSGTTTVNDMYFYHDAVARAGLQAGLRLRVGCSVLDFPTPFAADADGYLQRALAVRDAYHGEPLLSFALAPHAPYTVGDETFRKIITLAEQLDCGIHCHIHETRAEIEDSQKQYGMRPLERLAGLGVLGPNLVAAHAVQLTAAEMALLARHGVHVAHNPASNLKLASGLAPVSAMRAAGVNVGLGTDGPASNNRLDMLAEMRLAALLAKGESGAANALAAGAALEMATLAGARALGLDGQIGSLAAGKLADMQAIDLSPPETQPCYDPVSQIVYAAGREQISHVWVHGRLLMQQGVLTSLSLPPILAKAHAWRGRIAQADEAGAGVTH